MTIEKLDLNPILVNINKLKPYRFVEDHILQHTMVKPNDFYYQRNRLKQTIMVTCSLKNQLNFIL
jgi:hypothetical protein